jgi:hypothetical protein
MRRSNDRRLHGLIGATLGLVLAPGIALAQALPGGTLDPLSIPKYVTPLVIPPVMKNDGADHNYDIAVRQFNQQILPGGIWNTLNGRDDAFSATPVWSYGPAADPVPAIAPDPGSQFNYPAYTFETLVDTPVDVRWINDLVAINPATGFPCDGTDCPRMSLDHLLPIDQTLHWANPLRDCRHGPARTDCSGSNPAPYTATATRRRGGCPPPRTPRVSPRAARSSTTRPAPTPAAWATRTTRIVRTSPRRRSGTTTTRSA